MRALDAFRSRRVLLFIALGFGSGLPYHLTGTTLQAWMVATGLDPRTIGLLSLVALPYSLKFLWAPLFDRFASPWLGRRRGWLALFQVAVAGAIVFLGLTGPARGPGLLAVAAVTLAFCSANQDIVVDALRVDVLAPAERAAGSATFVLGYRVAMVVAGAVALNVVGALSFRAVYCVLAGAMAVGFVGTILAREPAVPDAAPRTLADAVIHPLRDFFGRPGVLHVVAVIVLFKAGDVVAAQMIIPFLGHLDLGIRDIGTYYKYPEIAGTIGGAVLGGVVATRWRLPRAMLLFGVLQAGANAGYLALALAGRHLGGVVAVAAIDHACGGMGAAVFAAWLLSLCDRRFGAAQYALLVGLSSVIGRLIGGGSGHLAVALGWPAFWAATIGLAVPGLIVVALLPDRIAEPSRSG